MYIPVDKIKSQNFTKVLPVPHVEKKVTWDSDLNKYASSDMQENNTNSIFKSKEATHFQKITTGILDRNCVIFNLRVRY